LFANFELNLARLLTGLGFTDFVLCRLEGGKADKRLLNMLPSWRLCVDGNVVALPCVTLLFRSITFGYCQRNCARRNSLLSASCSL